MLCEQLAAEDHAGTGLRVARPVTVRPEGSSSSRDDRIDLASNTASPAPAVWSVIPDPRSGQRSGYRGSGADASPHDGGQVATP